MKRIPRSAATTKLERAALQWLNDKGTDYDDGAAGAAHDLFYGGCSSGIVSHLVYTVDCEKFARQHIEDIFNLAQDQAEEFGNKNAFELLAGCNGADNGSSLNFLAWYGFEEAARNVCNRAGIEI